MLREHLRRGSVRNGGTSSSGNDETADAGVALRVLQRRADGERRRVGQVPVQRRCGRRWASCEWGRIGASRCRERPRGPGRVECRGRVRGGGRQWSFSGDASLEHAPRPQRVRHVTRAPRCLPRKVCQPCFVLLVHAAMVSALCSLLARDCPLLYNALLDGSLPGLCLSSLTVLRMRTKTSTWVSLCCQGDC